MIKAEVKKIDSSKREINIEVTGDRVKNQFEEAFKKIGETAKVAGFRPGKAPRDILEKNFSREANEWVLNKLIPEVYQESVKNENLDVVDLPEISDIKIERNSLIFKALVEIHPEINLKNYKGIKVVYQKIEATPDDLKRNLDSLKESKKIDVLDDKFARSLGYPDLAELEKAMSRQIFLQKENQQRQKIENEIIEEITKELDFKIPQSMINRQLEEMVKQAKVNLVLKGLPHDKIDSQEKEIEKELKPEAQKQVRVYLVLAEIAKKEKIPLDDHMPQHVMEFLLKEADWKEAFPLHN